MEIKQKTLKILLKAYEKQAENIWKNKLKLMEIKQKT